MFSPGEVWPFVAPGLAALALIVWAVATEEKDMEQLSSFTAVGPNGRAVARWTGQAWVVEFEGQTHEIEGGREDAVFAARTLSGVAYVH